MRIERLDFRWRVLGFGYVAHDCLESLALQQGYRVCGVCDELGLSEGYFREIFLRDVGMTPKEWMRWERMVVARRMGALLPDDCGAFGLCRLQQFPQGVPQGVWLGTDEVPENAAGSGGVNAVAGCRVRGVSAELWTAVSFFRPNDFVI